MTRPFRALMVCDLLLGVMTRPFRALVDVIYAVWWGLTLVVFQKVGCFDLYGSDLFIRQLRKMTLPLS